jgi:hypothetical protein
MPNARTPLIQKQHSTQQDGLSWPGSVVAFLGFAAVLFTMAVALVFEAHLPIALQGFVVRTSAHLLKLGLVVRHVAVAEVLFGLSGCAAAAGVGLSYKGSAPASATTDNGRVRHAVSGRVGGAIKAMASAEERQRLRDAEKAEDDKEIGVVCRDSKAPLPLPPAVPIDASNWHVRGMYEHQVLKAGLQQLDSLWRGEGLLEFVSNKGGNGSRGVLRKTLLTNLLSGHIHLRSVPANDISAAQGDVHFLTTVQLLRIRVLHIDYVPSGTGADTVNVVGSSHGAFLSLVDRLLFEQLGRKAVAGSSQKALQTADAHRLGRDAVILVAVAASIPLSPWWSWWITPQCRMFFHTRNFMSAKELPIDCRSVGGVLEVRIDRSRSDPNEPTGRLRWLDWSIGLANSKEELRSEPPRREGCTPKGASSRGAATFNAPISQEAICEARQGLRQTGRREAEIV